MTVSVEQAQLALKELIARTSQGEKVVILQDHQPVAELVPASPAKPAPIFGSCQGMITILPKDDVHLDDFDEYMR